jgi:hypothetical protein
VAVNTTIGAAAGCIATLFIAMAFQYFTLGELACTACLPWSVPAHVFACACPAAGALGHICVRCFPCNPSSYSARLIPLPLTLRCTLGLPASLTRRRGCVGPHHCRQRRPGRPRLHHW